MYTKYFGLTEEPFSIAANPRFLYMSTHHREGLAHLLYGIRSDSGFVLLTGEIGTGKTTLCRCLLEQLPEDTDLAFILNPKISVTEMLSSICDELGIAYKDPDASVKTFVDAINRHLLKRHADGYSTVVIIDEAQNLSFDVLEQLRLLTNLETNSRKLMRIILLGQPELETMLSRPELEQVEQRITARYHLQPLLRSEIGAYVMHRLAVAGRQESVFSDRVLNRLYDKTRGIPRLINIVCDRAMLGAYVKSQPKVSTPILNAAAREVQGRSQRPGWSTPAMLGSLVLLASVATTAALFYSNGKELALFMPRQSVDSASGPVPGPMLADESKQPGKQAAVEMKAAPTIPGSTLASWPDAAGSGEDTLKAAFAAQFKQWNIPLGTGNTDPCVQAINLGLRCFAGIGNLGSLARNDRPAILTLLDNEGRGYHATLLALDDQFATLAFAHGIETVSVQELEARWQGHYQLLWRTAPQGFTLVKPGSSGARVTWLTKNLQAAGFDSTPVHNYYDAKVELAVQEFQRSQGLVPDGIAGRQTLIHLNSATDTSVPRLSHRGQG